jgi:hypothetical protein
MMTIHFFFVLKNLIIIKILMGGGILNIPGFFRVQANNIIEFQRMCSA